MRSLISRLFFSKPAITTSPSFASSFFARFVPGTPSKDEPITRMDIRKDQFGTEAVRLLQDVADSHFIAFDFEFSGIAERNRERAGKPTLQDRYEETRASVHEYQPLQIGLTVVKFDETKGRYVLEPYNFNISPLPLLRERQFTRKWSMNSGAISFLHRNGFDFGKQMVHGVPYLSLEEETRARDKMRAEAKREDMVLKSEDQILVQHVRHSINAWQSKPREEQEDYLNIPHSTAPGIPTELNAYQRRLVHQTVNNEFPSMKTQGMGHFIQVTNPTSTQVESQKALEEGYRERDLARAIGFRWILDGMTGKDLSRLPDDYLLPALPLTTNAADGEKPLKVFLDNLNSKLKDRRKILIGHNCMVDVMFLYKMLIGELPPTIEEFRDKIHDLFPAIIDTKFLSNSFNEKYGRLSLGEVHRDLELQRGGPDIFTSLEFDRYTQAAYLHEAGYDSYITATVAIRMAAKLSTEGSQRRKEGERRQQKHDTMEAVAAQASPSLPEFGVQDGYVTANECADTSNDGMSDDSSLTKSSSGHGFVPGGGPASAPQPKQTIDGTERFGHRSQASISSTVSNTSYGSGVSSITPAPGKSAVVAVKTRSWQTPNRSASVDLRDESQVAALQSAFSSTTLYDKLDANSEPHMPGDEPASPQQPSQPEVVDLEKLVKEGKMMPRWQEEAAFWETYGNKLQVNGTVEGSWKLID